MEKLIIGNDAGLNGVAVGITTSARREWVSTSSHGFIHDNTWGCHGSLAGSLLLKARPLNTNL